MRTAWSLAKPIVRHTLLLLTSLLALLPFLWMVSLSLKSPGEMFQGDFSFWPDRWHALENYTQALTVAPLPRYLLNGALVCASILVLQLLICAPCAYALAKIRFAGREALFSLVLISLFIPQQVLALPLFILCYKLGLLDSYAALILPFLVSPFGIFLLRQFFKTIPDDIVNAARLDGVSELGIVWRIMMPMAMPAVTAFAIFSTVSHWNDLFWPLIVITSEQYMPPSQGVVAFHDSELGIQYGPLMAGAVMVVAPMVVAFLLAQRKFIAGLSAGGVK